MQDTSRLWFSKRWDDGEPVVENLLATLEDYYADLRSWISGTFFFSKVVRLCLDECAKEYAKRLLLRTHCISSAPATAALVEGDFQVCIGSFCIGTVDSNLSDHHSLSVRISSDFSQSTQQTCGGQGSGPSTISSASSRMSRSSVIHYGRPRVETVSRL